MPDPAQVRMVWVSEDEDRLGERNMMSKDRTSRQSKWGNKLEKWEDTEMRGPEAGWLGVWGEPTSDQRAQSLGLG